MRRSPVNDETIRMFCGDVLPELLQGPLYRRMCADVVKQGFLRAQFLNDEDGEDTETGGDHFSRIPASTRVATMSGREKDRGG